MNKRVDPSETTSAVTVRKPPPRRIGQPFPPTDGASDAAQAEAARLAKSKADLDALFGDPDPRIESVTRILEAKRLSYYPQVRFPVDGKRKSCGGVRWSELRTRHPRVAERMGWERSFSRENLALIHGPISQDLVSLDFDILDRKLADQVLALADRILGVTPYVRVGRDPKRVLIFRCKDWQAAQMTLTYRFAKFHGSAMEFLGPGSNVTIFGLHHKTKLPFEWPRGNLLARDADPTDAPLVEWHRWEAFVDAVGDLHELLRPRIGTSLASGELVESVVTINGMTIPPGWDRIAGVTYDSQGDGRAVDGRESYLYHRAYWWYVYNQGVDVRTLTTWMLEHDVRLHCRLPGREFKNEILAKFGLLRRKDNDGALVKRIIVRDEDGNVVVPGKLDEGPVDPDLDGILPAYRTSNPLDRKFGYLGRTASDPAKKLERALLDAKGIAAQAETVKGRLVGTIQDFLDLIWMLAKGNDPDAQAKAREALLAIWLLIAPTGAGKTSTLISLLTTQRAMKGPLGKPLLLLMPSHDNLSEVDEKAAKFAADANVAGLVTVHFKGVARGCLIPQVAKIQEMGIGVSPMCFSMIPHVDEDGREIRGEDGKIEMVPSHCLLKKDCPIEAQRQAIAKADLILAPMAYIDVMIPAVLSQNVSAVFSDERSWKGSIQHRTFPLSTLKMEREGYLTKAEKKDLSRHAFLTSLTGKKLSDC